MRGCSDETRKRQAELRVTFDNMGDGVVMFDEELRLAAWNSNFQQMLELPDDVAGRARSYAEYIRILAERGEFGTRATSRKTRRAGWPTPTRQLRFERTRPDGQRPRSAAQRGARTAASS